jgi:hypothetical protein
VFPLRKKKVVEQYQSDNSMDIVFHTTSVKVKWVPRNKLHVGNYTRVHFDPTSDVMVLLIVTEKDSYTRVTQKQCHVKGGQAGVERGIHQGMSRTCGARCIQSSSSPTRC